MPGLGQMEAEGSVEIEQKGTSRRKFLAGSAALLAGGMLLGAPKAAEAHSTGPPTDIDILNYILTLEHLENAFYRAGMRRFNEKEFEGARVFAGSAKEFIRRSAYQNFVVIGNHESAHVNTLLGVIRSLGGRPVPALRYDFGFDDVGSFVNVAQLLENTGVSAYDGGIAHIQAGPLLTAGATIATIEARHASYINFINGDRPFPDAFDRPVSPRDIFDAASGFITNNPRPYGPYASLAALRAKLPDKVIR